MPVDDETIIYITRAKGDYQGGSVRLKYLDDFCWSDISGGAKKYTGTYGLYAHVMCDKIDGKIGHSGAHGPCPHYIKVYIPKKQNLKIYDYLADRAGERPQDPYKCDIIVSDRIRQLVAESPGITTIEIADVLDKEEVRKKTVQNSVRYLKTHDFKNKPKLIFQKYGNTQKLFLDKTRKK